MDGGFYCGFVKVIGYIEVCLIGVEIVVIECLDIGQFIVVDLFFGWQGVFVGMFIVKQQLMIGFCGNWVRLGL